MSANTKSAIFSRRRTVRLAPTAAVFVAILALSRGPSDPALFLGATILLAVGLWTAWWTWATPAVSIEDGILVWRDTPLTRKVVVHLNAISDWNYDEKRRAIHFGMTDGTTVVIRIGRIADDDAIALLALLSRELSS